MFKVRSPSPGDDWLLRDILPDVELVADRTPTFTSKASEFPIPVTALRRIPPLVASASLPGLSAPINSPVREMTRIAWTSVLVDDNPVNLMDVFAWNSIVPSIALMLELGSISILPPRARTETTVASSVVVI